MSGIASKAALSSHRDEEVYFPFLDSLPLPVWLADERGRCKFLNRTGLAFLGKTHEQILTEGWEGFVHPEDVARMAARFADPPEAPPRQQIEFRMRNGKGDYRWFLCTLTPSRDHSGTISGCTGYSIDISDFKSAAESLYRSETRYRQLFDSNLIGVMYTSVSGGILDANHKFLEMVGYSEEDVQAGRFALDRYHSCRNIRPQSRIETQRSCEQPAYSSRLKRNIFARTVPGFLSS